MFLFILSLWTIGAHASTLGNRQHGTELSTLGDHSIDAESLAPGREPLSREASPMMRKEVLAASSSETASEAEVQQSSRTVGVPAAAPIPISQKTPVWKFGAWGKGTCIDACAEDGQRCSEDATEVNNPYRMSNMVRSLGYRCNDMSGPLRGIESPSITLGNQMDKMGKCWYNIVKATCDKPTPPNRKRLCRCVPASTCAKFACPAGYVSRRDSANINCLLADGCTARDRDRCCEEMAFCDEFQCPSGYMHRRDAHLIGCPDSICGSKYSGTGYAINQCCEQRRTRAAQDRHDEDGYGGSEGSRRRSGCQRPNVAPLSLAFAMLSAMLLSAFADMER